jgi:hypothetical protein
MENCNFPRVFFICLSCFIIFYHFSSFLYHCTTGSKNDEK